jgi:hypothetical protein
MDIYYDVSAESADPPVEIARRDIDKERQMAGLQSIINGYVIDIQMLELKIDEIQKQLDNIKKISNR